MDWCFGVKDFIGQSQQKKNLTKLLRPEAKMRITRYCNCADCCSFSLGLKISIHHIVSTFDQLNELLRENIVSIK